MKIELILQGKIKEENGQKKIVFENPDYYRQQVNQFSADTKLEITIKNKTRRRSNQQNRYWHGVCFPVIADLTGFTEQEAKEWCKKLFIKPKMKTLKGKVYEIPRGTSELDKYEGWNFTTDMMNLATELGGQILSPCEAGYNCGRSECPICSQDLKSDYYKNIEVPEGEVKF